MSYLVNKNLDFFTEVSKGNISGQSMYTALGTSDTIGSVSKTIWDGTGEYTFLSTASVLQISSTSINDTSSGVGARTLLISGLDSNYIEISETITLNGTSNVATTKSYLRINNMRVITSGTSLFNQGIITAKVSTTTYAQINVGNNNTLMGIYSIPAGKTAYITKYIANCQKGSDAIISNFAYPYSNAPYKHFTLSLYENIFESDLKDAPKFLEKTDLVVKAISSSPNSTVSIAIIILLVNNS